MKKALRLFSFILVVALISAATSYLVVRKSQGQTPDSAFDKAHAWVHEADLSSDQLKQLEPLEAALKRDLDALQTAGAKERIAVCQILNTAEQDPAKQMERQMERILSIEAAEQRLVMRHLLDMRKIMTPEQRTKFFTAMMHGICEGCRESSCVTGKDCICGMCDAHEHSK